MYVVFGALGAGIMYGFWLYNDNERLSNELSKCEIDTVSALDAQIEAQAEVELLKTNELR